MSLNAIETSTYLGFQWFLGMNEKPGRNALNLHFISANDLSEQTKIRMMRESKAQEVCQFYKQPREVYPIIYSFADGIQHLLLQHNITAHTIVADVIGHRDGTLTFAELKKRQISYLTQMKEVLHQAKSHVLIGNLFRMEKSVMLAQSIFTQAGTALTATEVDTLSDAANTIEFHRNNQSGSNIILPR